MKTLNNTDVQFGWFAITPPWGYTFTALPTNCAVLGLFSAIMKEAISRLRYAQHRPLYIDFYSFTKHRDFAPIYEIAISVCVG